MSSRHAPPPTKFGPTSIQPKPAAATGRGVPPPPTKFGPTSIQPKPAAATGRGMPPPPTKFAPPTIQTKTNHTPPAQAKHLAPPPPLPSRPSVLQRMEKATPVKIPIQHGLIHGHYEPEPNMADLHVDEKGQGEGLSPQTMIAALQEVLAYMLEREQQGGVKGRLQVRPTGAAIVKIVVEMLGETFGSTFSKISANFQKSLRKKFAKKPNERNPYKIDQDVLGEHFAYLDSLTKTNAMSMVPLISGGGEAYRARTVEEFEQDMLDGSPAGKRRLEQYKGALQDRNLDMGPGLLITISSDRIPAIIRTLESQIKK